MRKNKNVSLKEKEDNKVFNSKWFQLFSESKIITDIKKNQKTKSVYIENKNQQEL